MGYEWLATFNAVLNGIAAVLLVAGWVLIARGNWKAHRAVMIAAFSVSTIFLISFHSLHIHDSTVVTETRVANFCK